MRVSHAAIQAVRIVRRGLVQVGKEAVPSHADVYHGGAVGRINVVQGGAVVVPSGRV